MSLGVLEAGEEKLGLQLQVVGQKSRIIAEVKVNSVFMDLENFLQLRVGDRLVMFHSKGD